MGFLGGERRTLSRRARAAPSPASGGGLGGDLAGTTIAANSLLNRRVVAEIGGEDFETGHSYRDAHLDLLADQAPMDVVGDLAADLDAAVHRPRMHDQRVGFGQL